MTVTATATVRAPDAQERPIDLVHLARMTLGDVAVEREVLHLFDGQALAVVGQIRSADIAAIADLAHALKGSSRGIGAWRVAGAAEAVERAALLSPADLPAAVAALAVAVDEAREAIAGLLQR